MLLTVFQLSSVLLIYKSHIGWKMDLHPGFSNTSYSMLLRCLFMYVVKSLALWSILGSFHVMHLPGGCVDLKVLLSTLYLHFFFVCKLSTLETSPLWNHCLNAEWYHGDCQLRALKQKKKSMHIECRWLPTWCLTVVHLQAYWILICRDPNFAL